MSRLIDADAFRRELDNHWPFTKEEQSKHGIADLAKGTVLTVLGQMPTIEERKTGKWIYGESECGNDGYYCNKCGNFVPWKYGEYDIDFIKEFLFCNKCGADMRGETNE